MSGNVLMCLLLVVAVESARDQVDVVKETVNRLNLAVAGRSMSWPELPNAELTLPHAGPVVLTAGRLGNLALLVVRRETDQHLTNTTALDGSITYHFDVSLGLEELRMRYSYSFRWFLFLTGSGEFSLEARTNTARFTGMLTKNGEGVCISTLDGLDITELEDYELTLTPQWFFKSFVGYAIELAMNVIYQPRLYMAFNSFAQAAIKEPGFRSVFTELLCESFLE